MKVYILFDKDYSFTSALTLTILALLAKFNVDSVYWKHNIFRDTVAIRKVFELPPKESLSKLVSFESLYGICVLDF